MSDHRENEPARAGPETEERPEAGRRPERHKVDARRGKLRTETQRPPGPETDERSRAQSDGEERSRGEEPEPPASPGDKPAKPVERKTPWYKRPLLAGGAFLAVLLAVVGGVLWWLHSRNYETTDDAAVDVVPQLVSAELPGRVLRVLVADHQEVMADTVLVEIDPADFQARVAQANALGAQALAQADQARAQRGIFEAQREQARAGLASAEASAENAAHEFDRLEGLRHDLPGAVSAQQWDVASTARRSTAAQLEAGKKSVAAAEAQVNYAGSLLRAADAARVGADAQLQEAQLNLDHLQVRARVDGRVANLRVALGNYVQPGVALMAIVPREVYVTANFKETQLAHMRRGQPVEVQVDAYPDLKLTGSVDSFQPGTGQTFNLLPAENATGNWVKVVQRVPVKIALDALPHNADRLLGPGMSATVKVTVR